MNRAKQLRLDGRYGVRDVADRAGISTRTLAKVEAGRDVKAAALGRLAEFYGVQPSELLRDAVFPASEAAA